MPFLHFFFAAILALLPAFLSAQEWASYATIGTEPTAGHLCAGASNGKDIICASPGPYVDTSGWVGIGTTSPADALEIMTSGGVLMSSNVSARVKLITANDSGSDPLVWGQRSGGTLTSKTATPANQILVRMLGEGYDGSAYGGRGAIAIYSSELFTSTAKGTHIRF